MRRFLSVIFWSVIAAAFIGPGTITTAAVSGAKFGFNLLWALLFSTFACLILQEASARITVVTGQNLGQSLYKQLPADHSFSWIVYLIPGTIVLGCAAYEAGNILGSVAGANLATGLSPKILTIIMGLIVTCLLYFSTTKTVVHILG